MFSWGLGVHVDNLPLPSRVDHDGVVNDGENVELRAGLVGQSSRRKSRRRRGGEGSCQIREEWEGNDEGLRET